VFFCCCLLLNKKCFLFSCLLFRSCFFVAAIVHGTCVCYNYIFFGTCFYCGYLYFLLPITSFCLDCLLHRMRFCLAVSYVWRVFWSCRVTGSSILFQSFSHSSLLALSFYQSEKKGCGMKQRAWSLESGRHNGKHSFLCQRERNGPSINTRAARDAVTINLFSLVIIK